MRISKILNSFTRTFRGGEGIPPEEAVNHRIGAKLLSRAPADFRRRLKTSSGHILARCMSIASQATWKIKYKIDHHRHRVEQLLFSGRSSAGRCCSAEAVGADAQVDRAGHPISSRALTHAIFVSCIFFVKNLSKAAQISSGGPPSMMSLLGNPKLSKRSRLVGRDKMK